MDLAALPLPALLAAALAVGYVLGSLPFAVWIARRHGVDILKAGSGNPGATNVKRVVGKGPGNLCFALDAAKGSVAAALPLLLLAGEPEAAALAGVAGMLGALLGHSFSLFIGFRGGKGVATTVGGLLVLTPLVLLAGVAAWVATFFASRYVSLASIVMGLVLPVAAWLLGEPPVNLALTVVMALVLVVRHRSNIARLAAGTEHKWERKPASPTQSR